MNTKPEGSWSRESLRGTMDPWPSAYLRIFEPYCFMCFVLLQSWNSVFSVPVTNLNNFPGTIDTATLALSWHSFCYKILLSSLLVSDWKWGDSRKIDRVYRQQLELSRLAWATPLQEMQVHSDSFTLFETSWNLPAAVARKWPPSMPAQIAPFKRTSQVRLLNGVTLDCWLLCNLDAPHESWWHSDDYLKFIV